MQGVALRPGALGAREGGVGSWGLTASAGRPRRQWGRVNSVLKAATGPQWSRPPRSARGGQAGSSPGEGGRARSLSAQGAAGGECRGGGGSATPARVPHH